MKEIQISTKTFLYTLACLFLTFSYVCFTCDGIGGGGDSIIHYLYAHYAWKHPELLLHHWAKPFFTAIAAPFALGSFAWIKWFNTLNSFGACLLAYLLVNRQNTPHSWLILLFFFLSPFTITTTFTGLTEPLFACMLIAAVYLVQRKQPVTAALLLSFLPFVRSEGLVILLVFGFLYVCKRQYIAAAALLLGHVFYSLTGWSHYHDILWVFTKIPYAHLEHLYGAGDWFHFIDQLPFMVGPILFGLLAIGLIQEAVKFRMSGIISFFTDERRVLVYGCFVAFFIAHTLFWTFGLFGSMGLTRVFFGVMPLMAIIMLDGFNSLVKLSNQFIPKLATYVIALLLVVMMVFPFLDNPASYHLKRDVSANADELLLSKQVIPAIKQLGGFKKMYAADNRIPYYAGIDLFDTSRFEPIKTLSKPVQLKENEVLIWDSWYAVVEDKTTEAELSDNKSLQEAAIFHVTEPEQEMTVLIFLKAQQLRQDQHTQNEGNPVEVDVRQKHKSIEKGQ